MKAKDITIIENKWQKRWAQNKIFEANPDKRKKFFITTPYPYISGSLHIGHARVAVESDVYSRFVRMTGRNVLAPMSFHITGTPVLGISLAIETGDKDKIELYKSYVRAYEKNENKIEKIVQSFRDPQKIVDYFIPKMKDEYSTLGLGIDWRRSFTSGDYRHQKMVEWQFNKYYEKEYLVQGKYPVLFSLTLKNAVGEDDVAEGDTKPVEKQEFTLLKFKYENSYLIAATLRPETMYGQTNLWINPKTTYGKYDVNGEEWIISDECAEKISYQDKTVNKTGEIKGKDLIGKYCTAPVIERAIIILPGEFCDSDIGTGIVTSVPSDAPYDYIALKEVQENETLQKTYGLKKEELEKIKLIPIIQSKGFSKFAAVDICKKMHITNLKQEELLEQATQEVYKAGFHTGVMLENCGIVSGMNAQKAKETIKREFTKKGQADMIWETSRKAVSRDGGKIVVAVLEGQWFLDFNAKNWKKKAYECLKQITIHPEKYRKQFEDVFEWLDKRPCARRRGLGTALPMDRQWMIESLSDSTIYMSLYTISYKIKEYGITAEQLTKEFFDFVYLSKGEISNVSKKTGIKKEYLEKMKKEFEYWYPNDHRHTFVLHLPNHLAFSIFAHSAIFPKKYWPKKYSFHGLVISEGEKMSKSRGNTVTLLDVRNKYGADTFRAFLCNSTSLEGTLNWESGEVEKMKKNILRITEKIEEMLKKAKNGKAQEKFASTVSRIEQANKKATEYLKDMNLRDYSTIVLYEIPSIISKAEQKYELTPEVKGYITKKWIPMLCPLAPHISEELWEKSGEKNFASLTNWPKADEKKINKKEEAKDELIENLEKDIETVKKLINKKKISKITIITSENWKRELFTELQKIMNKTKNPKEIISAIMQTEYRKKGNEVMKIIQTVTRDATKMPEVILTEKEENNNINDLKQYLEKRFSSEIEVINGENTDNPKKNSAMPMKPAIIIE